MAFVVENAENNVRSLHPSYSRDSTGNRPTGTEINFVEGSKSYSKKGFSNRPKPNAKVQNFKPCFRCGQEHDCKTCQFKEYDRHL